MIFPKIKTPKSESKKTMGFKSTKTYNPNLGFSAAFRQWKAQSHCQYVHGYALGFKFTFEATALDHRSWVVDFGSLKPLKAALESQYDHKLVVAQNDPQLEEFLRMERLGLAQVRVQHAVGCEAFAEWGFRAAEALVNDHRVQVISCECFEHGANSAIYEQPFTLTLP